MKLEALIFDVDGTLAETEELHRQSFNLTFQQFKLDWDWDPETYEGGRNFGHLAYEVDDIYALCQKLMDAGVTINRPPRDGHMAFVRTPDGISLELLQKGGPREPAEPWTSMQNTGKW